MSKGELNNINIIYHDENYYGSNRESIIKDSHFIMDQTKGTLILTNKLEELTLLFDFISKSAQNCKSVLIMNGGSSEKVMALINKNIYMDFLIKGIIYCQNVEKYKKIFENNQFIEEICKDVDLIVAKIKNIFENVKMNQKLECNTIMNLYSYNFFYYLLHPNIATYFQQSKSINESMFNPTLIKDIDNNKKILFNKIYKFYNENKNKNDKEFIFKYLKDENLSILFNQLLIKKEKIDFDYIGYFAGNLMWRIVQYGKQAKKGVTQGNLLYKGIKLDFINLLEFIKNDKLIISFAHFLMISPRKELALLKSERNQILTDRKNQNLFSVILNIEYYYDNNFEPSIFDINELMPYPDEEEFIVLPFTFFELKNIEYNTKNMEADIYLNVIGKSEILENKVKFGKKLNYDKDGKIMISSS
jgi:hypothetical protein